MEWYGNYLQRLHIISSAPSDTPGYTWTRDFNGTITGSTVTISGNLHQENGYGADATVYLSVGSANNSASYSGSINETNPIWDQPFSLSVDVPSGAQYGSFSISMEIYNAGGRGLVVEGSLTTQAISSPNPTSTVIPKPTILTPTPTAIVNPDAILISRINREVEYYRSGHPDEWQFARIDTELYPGDHLKTGEDSSAGIVYGDLRSIDIGPESEVEILPPPTQITLSSYLRVKFVVTLNKGADIGVIGVETPNLAIGIRGTVFVVESNDISSTVKGIVDYVNATSTFTGESTIIGPGQMATATSNGLGSIATFDVAAEEAKWDGFSGGEPSNWFSDNMMFVVASAIVVVTVILVVVLLGVSRSRKRSKYSVPDDSSPYPPPPPPPPPQL